MSPEPVVGRKGDSVVHLDIDPRRNVCAEMPGSNVEAPLRVGQARKPDCVDKVCWQRSGGNVLDSFRFLVDFESGREHHDLFNGNWESDRTKCAGFPIHCVATISVLLRVSPSHASVCQETELAPDHDELCANEVDITVRRILVFNGLNHDMDRSCVTLRRGKALVDICGRGSSMTGLLS